MEKFDVNILGCGSAIPTTRRNPSSQVINLRDKLYMIDCGEGAQVQMRKMKLKYNRLNHIFLSHLHGDHCLGLIGLISTMGMVENGGELVIHAHPDAEKLFRPHLDYFCADLPFSVRFNGIAPQKHELIFEDRSVEVYSIPLKHRVPSCGFLFKEKEKSRHIISEMTAFHQVPKAYYNLLKGGADYVKPTGEIIKNSLLTKSPEPARKYAYCSDTAYSERIIPIIEGVDTLYHEATFCEKERPRAKETMHSTAKQAATIAKAAGVGKLLLGHYSARYHDLNPILTEAKSVFEKSFLVQDGYTFKI